MGRRCRQLQVPVTTVTRTACARLCGGECRVVVTGDGGPTASLFTAAASSCRPFPCAMSSSRCRPVVYRRRIGVAWQSPPSWSPIVAFNYSWRPSCSSIHGIPIIRPNIPVCGTVRSLHCTFCRITAIKAISTFYRRYPIGIYLLKIALRVVHSSCTWYIPEQQFLSNVYRKCYVAIRYIRLWFLYYFVCRPRDLSYPDDRQSECGKNYSPNFECVIILICTYPHMHGFNEINYYL